MNPELECDLVMKGGATSGMIYPPAVLRLAGKYRLRNIGGTSAGAVAAALTAAAELNRDNGGFVRLETTAKALQQPSFLRNLFQGNRQTEPLLKILMKAPEYGSELEDMALKVKGKSLSRLLLPLARWLSGIVADSGIGLRKGRWSGLFAGVAAALILSAAIWAVAALFGVVTNFLFWFPLLVLGLIFGAIGFKLGGLLTGIGKLYETATSIMPDNLFGICSGLRDPSNTYNQVAATEWLHDSIEKIAANPDRAGLLTFNQLEASHHPIKLQFVTTDISAGRPYVLPFDDLFVFKKEHFDKIFPADVVRHLVTKSRKVPGIRLPGHGEYYFLPCGSEWPVVVGARLSMSFPFLFSSVPLFRLPQSVRQAIRKTSDECNAGYVLPNTDVQITELIKQDINAELQNGELLLQAEHLVPHWFSDGGIASNFPIHFFDHWLPARPTFGITLRYLQGKPLEQGASPQQTAARRAYMHSLDQPRAVAAAAVGGDGDVWLPTAEDNVPSEWQAIHDPVVGMAEPSSVLKFALGIIKTMQNYRDNMQAALASYRERIVQVRLQPDEGGLNLDMPAANIQSIIMKGDRAGILLRNHFALRHHQWARLRVLVSRLEQAFGTINTVTTESTVADLIRDQAVPKNDFPYRKDNPDWCALERDRVLALLNLVSGPWRDRVDTFTSASTLRVTPEP